MPKYLLVYHGGSLPEDETARAAGMAAWGAWFGSLGDAVVDGGAPTGAAKTINPDGATKDGGGANPVSGYSIVSAGDLDAALALAKGCPLLSSGGSIEVAETIDVM
jgi:hypothetical protein